MSLKSLRGGFLLFFVLSGWVAVNLLYLQPSTSLLALHQSDGQGSSAHSAYLQTASIDARRAPSPRSNRGPGGGAPSHAPSQPSRVEGEQTALSPGQIGVRSRFLPVNTGNTAELVRALQRELKTKGYDPGGQDGQAGLVTRAAIFAFEYDRRLPLTAEPTEKILQALVLGGSIGPDGKRERSYKLSGEARDLVKATQRGLKTQGYWSHAIDGRFTTQLSRAIQRFETAQNLPTTGRISGRFMARLARMSGVGLRTAHAR